VRVSELVFALLLIIAPYSVCAEMDEKVVHLAKQYIVTLNVAGLTHTLTPLLERGGFPAEEHPEIIGRVGWEIASCIVDGLEQDSSPISQAAILEISDGADFATGKINFEHLYTEDEIEEYAKAYGRISAECNAAVFEKNYLIVR